MKMTMKRILGLAAVAAVVVALAPLASANCIPDKTIATFGGPNTVYITPGGDNVTGFFWQAGLPSANSGTYTEWAFNDVAGVSLNASLGDARVNACPANVANVLIEAENGTSARFLAASAGELNLSAVNFDLATGHGDYAYVTIPKPAVGGATRSGTNVNMTNVAIAGVGAGAQAAQGGSSAGLITGFELYKFSGSADPGRDASLWTLVQALPSANGAATSIAALAADCSNPANDQFYALRVTFADGVKSKFVGASTRVNCNPNLADPKYKPVKKGIGQGNTRN